MNKNSRRGNRWGAVIAGGLLMLFGLLVLGQLLDTIFVNKAEPPLPAGVPSDANLLYSCPVDAETHLLILPYGQVKMELQFGDRGSLKGLWSGPNARFTVTSPYNATQSAETQSKSWGNVLITTGSGMSRFTPWLSVSFTVESDYYHQWVDATAELDVLYPAESGSFRFVNESVHLERNLRFFVVSPEEYSMLEEHESWEWDQRHKKDIFGNVFAGLICLGFTVVGGLLVCEGLMHPERL